jgi:hypothetical protein
MEVLRCHLRNVAERLLNESISEALASVSALCCFVRTMDPLHATIEDFAAEGFTHIECHCPPMSDDKAKADQLAPSHLSGANYRATVRASPLLGVGGQVHSVKPWRLEDVLCQPLGRTG